jgi:hypothetical protein
MNLKIEIITEFSRKGLQKAQAAYKKLSANVKKSIQGMTAALSKAKNLVLAFGAAAVALGSTVKKAFKFETATVQFKILLGSMEKAEKRMEELKEFSGGTPFQFENIAQASRSLEVFTGGVMGATNSLRLVGDAAAGVGKPIEEVAFWVGRAYSAISNGKPFGEAAARLQEMGLLSGEARNKMEDLQGAGATNADVWATLTEELEKFNGGMKDLSETGNGLTSTAKDNWALNLAAFGEVLKDIGKEYIRDVIEWLKRIRNDGSIEKWAEKSVKAIESIGKAFQTVKEIGGFIKNMFVDVDVEKIKAEVDAAYDYASSDKAQQRANKVRRDRLGLKSPEEIATQFEEEVKLMLDLSKKQSEIDRKAAEKDAAEKKKQQEKLYKQKEKLEEKIRKTQAKEEISILKSRLSVINNSISALKPKAERKVQDWIKKQKDDAAKQKEEDAFQERVARLKRKRDTMQRGLGGKLSKKDREFLEEVEKAEEAKKEAQKKLKELEQEKKIVQQELQMLQKEQLNTQKDMKEQLEEIKKNLNKLLVMK